MQVLLMLMSRLNNQIVNLNQNISALTVPITVVSTDPANNTPKALPTKIMTITFSEPHKSR